MIYIPINIIYNYTDHSICYSINYNYIFYFFTNEIMERLNKQTINILTSLLKKEKAKTANSIKEILSDWTDEDIERDLLLLNNKQNELNVANADFNRKTKKEIKFYH